MASLVSVTKTLGHCESFSHERHNCGDQPVNKCSSIKNFTVCVLFRTLKADSTNVKLCIIAVELDKYVTSLSGGIRSIIANSSSLKYAFDALQSYAVN